MEIEFTFSGKNIAFNSIIKLRGLEYIKDFLAQKNGISNTGIIINGEIERLPKYIKYLKDDCDKYLMIGTPKGQSLFYNEIKEDIANHNLFVIDREQILKSIDEYNNKTYKEFEREIEEEETKFHHSPDRKRKHLEVYQEKYYGWQAIPLAKILNKPINFNANDYCFQEKTNYNFYCVEKIPDLIDTAYIEDYFSLLENFIAEIKKITDDYIFHYEAQKNKTQINREPQSAPDGTELKSFDEIFYHSELIEKCIDILRNTAKPLIGKKYTYIGKSKGAFCVWIGEMKRQGIIKPYSDKIYAVLLSKKFNFSFDESNFRKKNTRAEENYRFDFKTLLSKIKPSQLSRSGK